MSRNRGKTGLYSSLLVTLLVFFAICGGALTVHAESNTAYPPSIVLSQNTRCVFEDGSYALRGIVYVFNKGDGLPTVQGISSSIESDHDPLWISIYEEPIYTGPQVLAADEYVKLSFMVSFSPEKGQDTYRNRVEVLVTDETGAAFTFVSDVVFELPYVDPEELAQTPVPTTPPATAPPTTVPPTTVPPTSAPPTTVPPTTQPPTTAPPVTEPPTTQPPVTTPSAPTDVPSGRISEITENLSNGGDSVSVSLVVRSGRFSNSSLELLISVFENNTWKQVFNQCQELDELTAENATADNPYIHTFSNVSISGNPDYKVLITWSDDPSCSGAVIDDALSSCYRVPAYDYISTVAIVITMIIIAAYYIQRWSKESRLVKESPENAH